jgi:hypothetical protein
MEALPPTIWEDDEYVYIPEALFKHLPPQYRDAFEARTEQGREVARIADRDLQNLVRLASAVQATTTLGYIYHRLRTATFDETMAAVMEQETLTTAFVVTYSRLFVSRNGGGGVSRDQIPGHLRSIHDDIIEIRHKRYAHHGGHESIDTGLQIDFDDAQFRVSLQMSFGFYVGGRNEWKELVIFLDALMHERLYKILGRLKDKTGYEWTFSLLALLRTGLESTTNNRSRILNAYDRQS